jgi:hypothetical protein
MKLIGLEEHFVSNDVLAAWKALDPKSQDIALMHPMAATPGAGCSISAASGLPRWTRRGSTSRCSRSLQPWRSDAAAVTSRCDCF